MNPRTLLVTILLLSGCFPTEPVDMLCGDSAEAVPCTLDDVLPDCSQADEPGCGNHDGQWTGSLWVEMSLAVLGFSETCQPPLGLVVATGADPYVSGSALCSTDFFTAEFAFSGDLVDDPRLSGDVVVAGSVTDRWTGYFLDDQLHGTFEGQISQGGFTIEYVGDLLLRP